MTETITINNIALDRMRKVLLNYHNTLMVNVNDPITNEPYIFREMKSIGTSQYGNIPQDNISNSKVYNIDLFNNFINQIVNFKLSNKVENYDSLLRIRNNNNTTEFNQGIVKHIFSCMNTVNVFIDILEAYKYFMENDPQFKSKLKTITKIHLVNNFAKENPTDDIKINTGYNIDTPDYKNILFLSINSFHKTNHIFNVIGTKELATKPLFKDNNIENSNIDYERQTAEKFEDTFQNIKTVKINNQLYKYVSSNVLFTFEERDKNILKNFLYFLITMNTDDIRMQINALYYYYKFINLYILLILATFNIIINNLSSDNSKNTLNIFDFNNKIPYASNNSIFKNGIKNNPLLINNNNNKNITLEYANIIKYIQTEIDGLTSSLYDATYYTNTAIPPSIINTDIRVASAINYSTNQVQLNFLTNINLENVLNDNIKKKILIKDYNVLKNGRYYNIIDCNGSDKYIIIGAIIIDGTESVNDSYIQDVPLYDSTESTTIKIVNKGLLALKGEYNYGKKVLSDINGNIRMNTSKINNQKNVYNIQSTKNKLLDDQLIAYYVIVGAILIGLLGMNIMKVEKPTKIFISIVFTGIIVLLFIVYYIIGSAYIENFVNSEGFASKKIENFFAISKPSDLTASTTTLKDKKEFLSANIDGINLRIIELFQKVVSTIPTTESIDFYSELNNVMNNEKKDKRDINDILAFKKSLGNSNIDVLRYDINNKKIYITVLLFSAFIIMCHYMAYLYLPEKYTNLIVFVGMIFFIIIFAYYLIFTTKTVRNRSQNKYWGPQENKRL